MHHAIGVLLLMASSFAYAKGPTCEALAGDAQLLRPGARVVVGEMHGNDATAKVFGELVCLATQRGPVRVGLEAPQAEQPRLDAFLRSSGTAQDRKALLASPYWTEAYQDGRRSEAMLGLLERLRALRQGGAKLSLVAFDVMVDGKARDETMADALASALRATEPSALFLVLTGNLHARKTPLGNLPLSPMAQHLVSKGFAVTTLNARYAGGSTWICSSMDSASCGPSALGPGRPHPVGVVLQPSKDGAYDGVLDVGVATWSKPAGVPMTAAQQGQVALLEKRQAALRAYDAKEYPTCGAAFASLAGKGEIGDDAYSAACCYALANMPNEAFAQLELAAKSGRLDRAWMEKDTDLIGLRTDARWAPLLTALAKKPSSP